VKAYFNTKKIYFILFKQCSFLLIRSRKPSLHRSSFRPDINAIDGFLSLLNLLALATSVKQTAENGKTQVTGRSDPPHFIRIALELQFPHQCKLGLYLILFNLNFYATCMIIKLPSCDHGNGLLASVSWIFLFNDNFYGSTFYLQLT
jgi:hypothetical protein